MSDEMAEVGPTMPCSHTLITVIDGTHHCADCGEPIHLRTATGKIVTPAEVEQWAAEAERGYDVSHLKASGVTVDPVPGYDNDDDLRRDMLHVQRAHDPANQDHNYERCELCHYTRHPCESYDLATTVLYLLDRGRTDA